MARRRRRPKTRQEKWPNTVTFTYYNANPKGRITGDCAFRAIATALEQDYNQTVMEMAELMCQTGWALNDKYGIDAYLKSKGWEKQKQPRKADGTKYTGKDWCKAFSGTCLANIGGHHITCFRDHKVYDIWDCTDKCIGNFWVKKS